MESNIWELTLPRYLKEDISAMLEGERTNSRLLDCLYCEVQGSINAALHGFEITEEQAIYLRKKYLDWEE